MVIFAQAISRDTAVKDNGMENINGQCIPTNIKENLLVQNVSQANENGKNRKNHAQTSKKVAVVKCGMKKLDIDQITKILYKTIGVKDQ